MECFGYDFMFDDEFKPYLIEVNTNPCLDQPCPLLSRFIPSVIDSAFRIAVDPLFPFPEGFWQKKSVVNDITPEIRFELIFDDKVDGPELMEVMKRKEDVILESDDEEGSDAEND